MVTKELSTEALQVHASHKVVPEWLSSSAEVQDLDATEVSIDALQLKLDAYGLNQRMPKTPSQPLGKERPQLDVHATKSLMGPDITLLSMHTSPAQQGNTPGERKRGFWQWGETATGDFAILYNSLPVFMVLKNGKIWGATPLEKKSYAENGDLNPFHTTPHHTTPHHTTPHHTTPHHTLLPVPS